MKQNNDFWKSDKSKFVILFTGVFLGTFLLLYFIGFVPDELSPDGGGVLNDLKLQTLEGSNTATPDNSTDNSNQAPADAPASNPTQEPVKKIVGEKPLHITAATVGIDIDVENPKSEDNAILNEYLTRGAVHYPGSADLGAGNTFIFGHSSNWAVVHNKAYKALNGIDKLQRGDEIFVDSDTHRYIYQVVHVYQAAADAAFVDLGSSKNMLTLSTCDIFGAKQSRFVAEAVFAREENL